MTKPVQDRPDVSSGEDTRDTALTAIDRVIGLCLAAMPDAAVEREIRELEALKTAVGDQWPLDDRVKRNLDIGSFAAKNIEDWNPMLADSLMRLDHEVRHKAFSGQNASTENVADSTVQISLAT